ncbi:MAG: alkylhydroperoxidase family enzyme [Myxococcota bacterium]|jgi:alkylhydroperoxidase family enzyme
MVQGDVDKLRDAGWSDLEIHDATQTVAYFNYVNRIAQGLGVNPESDCLDTPE